MSTTAAIRDAFVAAVVADPFRSRDAVLEEVALRTGAPPEAVRAALPAPGTPPWVAEFSPSRSLPELRWERSADELRAGVTSDDQEIRTAALRDLLVATVPSDDTRAILLEVLATTWVYLRIDAIAGAWRHFVGRRELRERLVELIGSDTDERVRVAAIERLGRDADRDPETVTALMAATVGWVPEAVRVAALRALGSSARGYPRAVGVVLGRMLDDEPAVRVAAFAAACQLVDDGTAARIARAMVDAGLAADPQVGSWIALDRLRTRRPDFVHQVLADPGWSTDPARRAAALPLVGVLMSSDEVSAAAAIQAGLHDADERVREVARTIRGRVLMRNLPPTTDVARGSAGPLSVGVQEVLG